MGISSVVVERYGIKQLFVYLCAHIVYACIYIYVSYIFSTKEIYTNIIVCSSISVEDNPNNPRWTILATLFGVNI